MYDLHFKTQHHAVKFRSPVASSWYSTSDSWPEDQVV